MQILWLLLKYQLLSTPKSLIRSTARWQICKEIQLQKVIQKRKSMMNILHHKTHKADCNVTSLDQILFDNLSFKAIGHFKVNNERFLGWSLQTNKVKFWGTCEAHRRAVIISFLHFKKFGALYCRNKVSIVNLSLKSVFKRENSVVSVQNNAY